MRTWQLGVVAVLAAWGCKKSVDDKLGALKDSYDGKAYCALVGDIANEKVKTAFVERLDALAKQNHLPDAKYATADADCVPEALSTLTPPPPMTPQITRLAHKTTFAKKARAMFDALPPAEQKAAALDAFAELGSRWDLWHNSAKVAAPLFIAELDKLGGAEDPKFFAGLVGAYAMYDEMPPAIKERVTKLGEDPRLAAAWKTQLVATTTAEFSDSWMGFSKFITVALPELVAHKVVFDKDAEIAALIKACTHPRSECGDAIKLDEVTKKNVRDSVAKIKDTYEQASARTFAMKLGGGTVEDIEPMFLALEQAQSDAERVDRNNGGGTMNSMGWDKRDDTDFDRADPKAYNFADTVAGLAAIGPTATPKLLEALALTTSNPDSFVRRRAAARALAKSDPTTLAKVTLERFEKHDEYVRLFDRGSDKTFGSITNAGEGMAIASAMVALTEVKTDGVNLVYLRALSSPDARMSGESTEMIKKRLSRDEAVDALFAYMSAKNKYAQYEIDTYVGLVVSFGAEATAAVVRNLEAMLAATKSPDKVFWAHKVVALTALEKIGTSAAVDVLGKYADDGGGYVGIETPIDENGRPIGEPVKTPKTFKTLVAKALGAVRSR